MRIVVVILILLFALPVTADDFCNVKYIKNYDGDTYTFDLGCDLPSLFKTMSVRLYGIDTPEIRTSNPEEKEKAIEAKLYAQNKLQNAKCINLLDCQKDKYFRLLCKINYDGIDLTQELLDKNLGYPYFGGKKQKFSE